MKHCLIPFSVLLLSVTGCRNELPQVSVCHYLGDKKAAVSFTYDDGTLDHYTEVFPHLEKNGLKGTFWIIGKTIQDTAGKYMSWPMLKEMSEKGHEISNHSWSHRRMTELSLPEIYKEVFDTDNVIEDHIGKRPSTFAFPYNAYDMNVMRAVMYRVGLRLEQTGQGQGMLVDGRGRASTCEGMKAWLDSLVDNNGWGVTMTHGITGGYDRWKDPEEYWKFLEYAGTRSGDVWYATFADVSMYLKEASECTLHVSTYKRKVVVEPYCSLDRSYFFHKLTLKVKKGKKVKLIDFNPYEGKFEVKI